MCVSPVGVASGWGAFPVGLTLLCWCGGVLLSHTLPGAVPSALSGLASRFGKVAGRFPDAMTTARLYCSHRVPPLCCGVGPCAYGPAVGGWVECFSYSGCKHHSVQVFPHAQGAIIGGFV